MPLPSNGAETIMLRACLYGIIGVVVLAALLGAGCMAVLS